MAEEREDRSAQSDQDEQEEQDELVEEDQDEQDELVEERFVEDLLTRGEAAEPDEEGNLPGEATHEIEERTKAGRAKVKRRRFSAF